MLLPKSICVCIPSFKSVTPRVCLAEYHLWLFFGPDMNTKIGVVIYIYFKNFPNYIDSKYIWVHGSNSLAASIFPDTPFLAILALHRKRKRWGLVGPSPCYSQS